MIEKRGWGVGVERTRQDGRVVRKGWKKEEESRERETERERERERERQRERQIPFRFYLKLGDIERWKTQMEEEGS